MSADTEEVVLLRLVGIQTKKVHQTYLEGDANFIEICDIMIKSLAATSSPGMGAGVMFEKA